MKEKLMLAGIISLGIALYIVVVGMPMYIVDRTISAALETYNHTTPK